jgi:hypothetical protein
MLNDSTNHFIAHHSSWQWVELRAFLVCKYFLAVGMACAVYYRGFAESEVILMLVFYSQGDFVIHIFGCYQWV